MIFLQRMFLILFMGALVAIAGWSGYSVYYLSAKRAEIKKDYSVLNNITFGLLSVNAWRDHLIKIANNRIDDFEFTSQQEKILKREISKVLHAVIDKADSMVQTKQKTIGGKLTKFAVNTFVKEERIHKKVPAFTETIISQLKKPRSKESLKFLVRSKIEEFSAITYDSVTDVSQMKIILDKYGASDVTTFNRNAQTVLDSLQHRTYFFSFVILAILFLFLVLWWMLKFNSVLHTPFYVMSVLLALIVLFSGLTSPMIEIDARIQEMRFFLIGEPIAFNDQVLFFQSKSIIDVVSILLETGKWDSILVGVLILAFSVLFPIGKLLAIKIYLLSTERIRKNKVIQFLAFKSGKWSMADVYVVAIFMSYIGFKGILESQLANLNIDTPVLSSISTSHTSLQPGFIIFVGFVLFSFILSIILKRIIALETSKEISLLQEKPEIINVSMPKTPKQVAPQVNN
jgi:hypothetical protein